MWLTNSTPGDDQQAVVVMAGIWDGSFPFPSPCIQIDVRSYAYLGGGFKYVLFSSLFGEGFQFDKHIFQMGWFNRQLDMYHLWLPTGDSVPLDRFWDSTDFQVIEVAIFASAENGPIGWWEGAFFGDPSPQIIGI